MKRGTVKKYTILFVVFMIWMSSLIFIPTPVKAIEETDIFIDPVNQIVSYDEIFSLNIACIPNQPIKSFEFDISFNPSLLQANTVSEGDIFTGYTTFFNNGTIDNNEGTITDIYGLILGEGMVTDPGSFISLSFTAQSSSGTSAIQLSDVGVTNDTMYIPIIVTNGTVTVEEYTLTITVEGSGSVLKDPDQATYSYEDIVQLTAIPDSGWSFNHWSGDVNGSINPTTIVMTENKEVTAHFTQNSYTLTVNIIGTGSVTKNPDQPTYTYGQIVQLHALVETGWVFDHWSGDHSGSTNPDNIIITGNISVNAHFRDDAPPQMSNFTIETSNPVDTNPAFGWVNVSCTVTDNVAISMVIIKIQNPSGFWNNVSMQNGGSGQYFLNSTSAFSNQGNYSYSLWVNDTSNNVNTSSIYLFSLSPNWDINNDGFCTIFDLVLISNHYGEDGDAGWIREDVDNNGHVEILDLILISNQYGQSW